VARERAASVRSRRVALWVVRFVLCFLLTCIVVVPVPFVCCSVKLPLSRPTSFCLFLSILLCTLAEGGAAVWRFCCLPQPNHNTDILNLLSKPSQTDIFPSISAKSLSIVSVHQLLLIFQEATDSSWGSFHTSCHMRDTSFRKLNITNLIITASLQKPWRSRISVQYKG